MPRPRPTRGAGLLRPMPCASSYAVRLRRRRARAEPWPAKSQYQLIVALATGKEIDAASEALRTTASHALSLNTLAWCYAQLPLTAYPERTLRAGPKSVATPAPRPTWSSAQLRQHQARVGCGSTCRRLGPTRRRNLHRPIPSRRMVNRRHRARIRGRAAGSHAAAEVVGTATQRRIWFCGLLWLGVRRAVDPVRFGDIFRLAAYPTDPAPCADWQPIQRVYGVRIGLLQLLTDLLYPTST